VSRVSLAGKVTQHTKSGMPSSARAIYATSVACKRTNTALRDVASMGEKVRNFRTISEYKTTENGSVDHGNLLASTSVWTGKDKTTRVRKRSFRDTDTSLWLVQTVTAVTNTALKIAKALLLSSF
jgi:hypothetical protein